MDTRRTFLLILSFAAFLTSTHTEDKVPTSQDVSKIQADSVSKDYRLPRTMHPTAYTITITPTLSGEFEFLGETTIKVTVDSPTQAIVLHRGSITITKLSVTVQDKSVVPEKEKYDEETEMYRIDLKETLNVGDNVVLNFEYKGHLRDDMIGFYRSSYVDSNNDIKQVPLFDDGFINPRQAMRINNRTLSKREKSKETVEILRDLYKRIFRWLAITQFQTTHARHAFPCFDEPDFKAKFTIQIKRSKEYTTISNMEQEPSKEITPGLYLDTFKESVPMSTYLVAFAVFDFASSPMKNIKVWSRPEAIEQTSYALDIGYRTLRYLETFFDQDYMMAKMDMVAVPDFAAGAMENWGMITYRESRMLYDEKESNVVTQQNVASVIVHEITHMWFGNLLTPSWWGYLWLSEGFARYFQYFGTAMLETTWNMEGQFLVEQHQAALAVDAIETSKPMTREVATPSDIGTIGDSITYSKGASIVRMMSHIVGAAKFQQALQVYIRDNKGKGIVEPKNLWTAFHSVNFPEIIIESVMNTWTEQSGFPVLSVKIEKGKVMLRQERFLLRNLKSTPVNILYHIPITYTTKNNIDFKSTETKLWMQTEQYSLDADISDTDWIIFNVQQTGFYRVNYDHNLWYRIIDTLNSASFDKIHVYNRAGIIDDLMNLARAGLLNYTIAIDGLQYLQQENNYLPFKAAIRAFDYLTRRFSGDGFNYTLYKNYILSLIKNIYDNLGYEDRQNDDRLTIQLRRELNDLACKFDHEKCVDTSLKHFRRWIRDETYWIKPNQRSAVYSTGVAYGSSDEWNHLWNHYKNSNVASEQSVVLSALGCSTNKDILKQYLHYAISPYEKNRIRKQDSKAVFSSVYSSSLIGVDFVLDFIDENHTEMAKYYDGYSEIGSILSGASQYLSTQQLVDKFEHLIGKLSEFSEIHQSLSSSLELAKYELTWYENNVDEIVSKIRDELSDNEESTIYRLPKNLMPTQYLLSLEPFLEPDNFTFTGYVQIIADVVKSTNEIVLHAADIVCQSFDIRVNNKQINVTSSFVEKYDFLVIKLEKSLNANTQVSIGINYTGKLNKEMRGFYKSSYVDENNEKRWLAATHLEPVGARKMFPCFDEPAMKAVFSVIAIVPEGYTAISNMKVAEIKSVSGTSKIYYRFKDTKLMSTYLLALVVSDFEHWNNTVENREYRVWARPNTSNETSYALSLMEPLVDTYEKLLKHAYTLTKLDMVALPDFVSGAMENWGLLTFKEPNLLWDPERSGTRSKQKVTNVISHEIAHQWFGNLVTPSWWKYIWLNEGFARYFQYFATSHINDTWELESQFIVDQLHSAFKIDALASSHPMTHDVHSPAEIRNVFDTISYAKAASVIRMIEKTLGTDIFYAALRQYLDAKKFNNASPEDLYEALADQITDGKLKDNLYQILDSWTTQAGYPVVTVSLSEYKNSLHFTQERFLLRNDAKNESIDNIWHIPITWTTGNQPNFKNTKPQFWLSSAEDRLKLDTVEEWIIVNVQQAGYYRVNYNEENWRNIIRTLMSPEFEQIDPMNRAALIDDLMNLARAGYVGYPLVFEAMEYLKREQHYLPWRAFFNGLSYLDGKFEGRQIYEYFSKHMQKIMAGIVRKLVTNNGEDDVNTPHTSNLLRIVLDEWSCKYSMGPCAYRNPESVPLDLQPALYCRMVRTNWKPLWDEYKKATITSEKQIFLKALGCSESNIKLKILLEEAITEDSWIRYQDSTGVFASVYESSLFGLEFVMKFMKSNLNKIIHYYNDYSKIKTIMKGLATRITTEEQYTQYKELSDLIESNVTELKEALKTYNDLILYEQNWYRKNIPMISYWLEYRYHVEDYRLPTALRPTYYDLTLGLENTDGVFEGLVIIDIEVVEPTHKIVLNSYRIQILEISVYETADKSTAKESKELKIIGANYIEENQKLVIYLDSYIEVSQISVKIKYRGSINSNQQGLYSGEYEDSAQNKFIYLATYFRPNYARMAFPCFDEPAFKAKFKLRIRRSYELKSLSNVPLERTEQESSHYLDIYKETPIMSTYLVAFVVSNFKPIRNVEEMFNIWGIETDIEYGSSIQYDAFKCYEALRHLVTKSPNSLEKINFVSLPNLQTRTVESWGLFSFQDDALLYEEGVIPLSQKHSILANVAKEIAHIYFGNLVTCEWWSYTWLNEGLSQYFQWLLFEKGLDETFISDYFVVDDMHDVMNFDHMLSSHSLNYPVSSPLTLKKTFDKISSKKAASLMRMLHYTFGGSTFYLSLKEYVDSNKHKTVTPNNLWRALESNLKGVSIENIMDKWLKDEGYPVVRANLDHVTGTLELTQVRLTGGQVTVSSDFHIPISIASEIDQNFEDTSPKFWLTKRQDTFVTQLKNHWFILNVQQAGYYRVIYDETSLEKIINILNSDDYKLIHVVNRAQLIDDLFHLVLVYEINYSCSLKAALYLRHEKENLPWKAFEKAINYIWENINFSEDIDKKIFQRYVTYLTEQHADRLGFDDSKDDSSPWPVQKRNDQLNRELILSLHCKFDNEFCNREATKWSMKNGTYRNISANAKPAILCTLIKQGDSLQWREMWQTYLTARLRSEKLIYLDALGCTENESDIKEYLKHIFTSSIYSSIRKEDIPRALASIYKSSKTGWKICYKYVTNHEMAIYDLLKDWDQVAEIFIDIVHRIPTFKIADEFNFFLKNNHETLQPIMEELTHALYMARLKIRSFVNLSSIIIRNMKGLLKSVGVNDFEPNISTTQSSNILLVMLMSIIPFLLVR